MAVTTLSVNPEHYGSRDIFLASLHNSQTYDVIPATDHTTTNKQPRTQREDATDTLRLRLFPRFSKDFCCER